MAFGIYGECKWTLQAVVTYCDIHPFVHNHTFEYEGTKVTQSIYVFLMFGIIDGEQAHVYHWSMAVFDFEIDLKECPFMSSSGQK